MRYLGNSKFNYWFLQDNKQIKLHDYMLLTLQAIIMRVINEHHSTKRQCEQPC